ncbi:MAG: protoheme IX farnesyltransferase [Rickettsiales bacterium]|nr:MAG: protoheme IX farnesyltransferase [Rickettsiales bacterium]
MKEAITAHSFDANLDPSVKDYIRLMKPRVMSLVVFTALCGLIMAPGSVHPLIGAAAILFIALGAGSAATINMWYDRDIDAVMVRTQKRPIVTGAINPDEALSFGIITAVLSVLMMALCVNIISSFLLAFTIAYYVFIYTFWLKRSSIQNVVIGGVSGALPPMIGWASVNGEVSWQSFSLFLIIFIWTPPHSWALALFRIDDYRNCNVPMMPVIKGEYYTKKQIMLYSIIMVATATLPYFLDMAGKFYLLSSITLGIGFLYYAIRLFSDYNHYYAKKLFWYSIFYLFSIFLILLFKI